MKPFRLSDTCNQIIMHSLPKKKSTVKKIMNNRVFIPQKRQKDLALLSKFNCKVSAPVIEKIMYHRMPNPCDMWYRNLHKKGICHLSNVKPLPFAANVLVTRKIAPTYHSMFESSGSPFCNTNLEILVKNSNRKIYFIDLYCIIERLEIQTWSGRAKWVGAICVMGHSCKTLQGKGV